MAGAYLGTIREYGCIGKTLGHSYSGEIHRLIGQALCDCGVIERPYDYVLQQMGEDELEDFFARRAFRGINVTIPYKQRIIPLLDELTDAARAIGAVNTVLCRDGRLIGDNTDFYGMQQLLHQNGITLKDKKVLVLGTGGTSATALAVATAGGAREVFRVSRRPTPDTLTYEALLSHTDASVIINTTPVGMYPDDEGCPLSPEMLAAFEHLEGVADAVYHPLCTELVLAARARGAKAAGGLGMLVAQGVAAAERFLNVQIPDGLCRSITSELYGQKQNIVLIGMPGSGKSTVGALLAAQTGKELLDTDAAFAARMGMAAGAYIQEKGEAAFREAEAAVIREDIAPRDGVIVATGGGAVLRDDNVRRLRRGGVLVYLDRPLCSLIATSDRPLSCDPELLRRRYEERHGRYEAVADVTVTVAQGDTPEKTAADVQAALKTLR